MGRYNKTTASVIIGAVITIAAALWPGFFTTEIQGAIHTIAASVGVWIFANS